AAPRDESRPEPQARAPRARRPERAEPPVAARSPAAAPRHRGREDRDDAPVVGLGDHVPSFLLRPTRLPRPVAVGED
ncbi:MAG: DEAD/DEAH box helicase, partial [Pseudomonadota bacterium]|nr:DEAD/DEAH box helicase [Pseudomonadota bacterium]